MATFTPAALAAFAAAGALSAGCASRVAAPDDTLVAWADAVDAQDWRGLYSLLDPAAQRDWTLESYTTWCESHQAELLAQAARLRDALRTRRVDVEAQVVLLDQRAARVVLDDGRWRMVEQIPLLEGGDTPADTLVAIGASLQSPAAAQALRLMSAQMAERYRAEWNALSALVGKASLDSVSVFGDVALVTIDAWTLRLVREEGVWLLDSVQQPTDPYASYYDDW